MASPQVENGYTRIANELLEALAKIRISGEEHQVLWVIVRKTYGFKKKEDVISLSQFCKATGIPKPHVCRSLNKLHLKNIIIRRKCGIKTIYQINKDYGSWSKELLRYDREKIFKRDKYTCFWCKRKFTQNKLEVDHIKPLVDGGSNKECNLVTSCRECNRMRGAHTAGITKNGTVPKLIQYQKWESGGAKNGNKGVPKMVHTKDNNTKDTYTKDNVELIKKIVFYLNEKAGKKFSYKTDETKKLINGRIADGFQWKDFKYVIDLKVAEWKRDKYWKKFLRPNTLFRPSNFENYLNEDFAQKNKSDKYQVDQAGKSRDKKIIPDSLWEKTTDILGDSQAIEDFFVKRESVLNDPQNVADWQSIENKTPDTLIDFIERRAEGR